MPLIALDVETGGLNWRTDALLSISLVWLTADHKPARELDVYLIPEPGKTVSPEAAKVNGYTPEKWAERGAVSLRDGMKKIQNWIPSKSEVVAHNASFDKSFIDQAEKESEIRTWLHPRWRCSMIAFLTVNDALTLGAKDAKLETLARMSGHWGTDYVRGDHASIDDAIACAAGYRWLLEKIRLGEMTSKEASA